MTTPSDESNLERKENTTEEGEKFVPFSVILGRDLIFMDWTVQFGSQLLGIVLGGLLGFFVGVNVFTALFSGGSVSGTVYLVFQIGIILSVVGLCVYYIYKLGIRINSPKKIANNKLNIIKISFFILSSIFGLAYIYNAHLAPAVHRIAGITTSGTTNGGNGDNGSGTVEPGTSNEYIMLLGSLMLGAAIFALLYAGIVYSINMKVRTTEGVAVGSAAILLTFYLLSQYSLNEYLIKAFQTQSYSVLLVFLTDLFYYLCVSLVVILAYHLSRRIELAIIALFFGFSFGYAAPSNVFLQIISLKWGVPVLSDGVDNIQDRLALTLEGFEIAGLIGMIAFPLIFYKDTAKFAVKLWNTIKKQGIALLIFTVVVFIIELIIQYISQYLGIFLFLIVFIILVGVVNVLITKKYGKQSYTGLLTAMSQATLQMSESIVPPLEKQTKILEMKTARRDRTILILGTTIPLAIYFLIMYLTTAITAQVPIGTTIFLFSAVPISIGIVTFSITFFFVKNPLIKGYFNYALKAVGLVGSIIYFIYACYGLVYNEVGIYPLISLFYIPFIIIAFRVKRKVGTLLLSIAGENKTKALKKLFTRKDIDYKNLEDNFDLSPSLFKIWLALILTKRGEKASTIQKVLSLLTSSFPLERATGALCLLYLNDEETIDRIIKVLENDTDPRVREAIAYGLRYYKNLPEEIYKRIIDSQHYEDDAVVLETIKQTLSILDQRFSPELQEEILLEEI